MSARSWTLDRDKGELPGSGSRILLARWEDMENDRCKTFEKELQRP